MERKVNRRRRVRSCTKFLVYTHTPRPRGRFIYEVRSILSHTHERSHPARTVLPMSIDRYIIYIYIINIYNILYIFMYIRRRESIVPQPFAVAVRRLRGRGVGLPPPPPRSVIVFTSFISRA